MKAVRIPEHWSQSEAVAVLDFLDDIMAAIWDIHELMLVAHYTSGNDVPAHKENKEPPLSECDNKTSGDLEP